MTSTTDQHAPRDFNLGDLARVGCAGHSAALDYARWLLRRMRASVVELDPTGFTADMPVLTAGQPGTASPAPAQDAPLLVRLWDFQVGQAGTGVQACAVSGIAWVIGLPGRAPLCLPGQIPEKWCGTLGAAAALSWHVERATLPGRVPPRRVFDVSAAEVLRACADQNFGNHRQMPHSWRRNGRISPEHGGVFPQGFFKCRDGHVAVIGRSREDWERILAALGDPAWATEALRNPFRLALDSAAAETLFEAELQKYSRKQLLDLALTSGATFAPLYSREEIPAEQLVRDSFFDAQGQAGLPFELFRATEPVA